MLTGSRKHGFTLVEMVCVLGIMGIVAGLLATTLTRHQRMYRAVSESVDVRRGVRDGISVLAEEIRGASATDTVRLLSDSAVELFTNLGSSVLCAAPASSDVALAPSGGPSSLNSWLAVPDTGDIALIYRAASSTSATWDRYRIRAVSARSISSACAASGFGSGGSTSYVLTLSPPPSAPLAGQPIRFIRRGRYSLYKSSDAKWYLGYRRCNAIGASSCGTIQPLSGYYQAYSSDTSRTGLLLRYFDAGNHPLTGAAAGAFVARIQITARAVSATPVVLDGSAKSARDSSNVSVALRNHP